MRQAMHKAFGAGAVLMAIATGQWLIPPSQAQARVSTLETSSRSALESPPFSGSSDRNSRHDSRFYAVEPVSADSVPSTTVLDYGAEPRQVLRFTPVVGTEQQTIMDMTTETAITVNNQTQPAMSAPGTRLVMDTVVTDIDENGSITIEFVYSDVQVIDAASLPAPAVEMMRSQMSSMIGTAGTVVLDNQGRTQGFELVTAETMNPALQASVNQLAQSFQQISSPLPDDAIGVGAVWQVPQTININGKTIDSLATFELVSQTDNLIELEVSVEQEGEISIADLLPVPETINVSDQQIQSSGSGQTFIDLNQVMPLGSDLTVNTQSTTLITEGGFSTMVEADVLMEMLIISDDFELPTRALTDPNSAQLR